LNLFAGRTPADEARSGSNFRAQVRRQFRLISACSRLINNIPDENSVDCCHHDPSSLPRPAKCIRNHVNFRELPAGILSRIPPEAAMVTAIARANMLDTEHVMAFCFGASRQGMQPELGGSPAPITAAA
jgi:hypothetical protein